MWLTSRGQIRAVPSLEHDASKLYFGFHRHRNTSVLCPCIARQKVVEGAMVRLCVCVCLCLCLCVCVVCVCVCVSVCVCV